MKQIFAPALVIFALSATLAAAQTAETTTTQSTTMQPGYVAPVSPPPGTVESSRETHAVDAYGNRRDSVATTTSTPTGQVQDSRTVTTTAAPPPPPVATTTTTTTSTTTDAPN